MAQRAAADRACAAAAALLDWTPDPVIERVVSSWPGDVRGTRAAGLGLAPDASFEAIVRDYVRENPGAVKRATS